MKKCNYIFLGIALSYIIIAVVQWSLESPLNASLYVTIAFVSLELTALEIIKTLANGLLYTIDYRAKLGKEYLQLLQKNKSVFEKHPALEEQTKAYESKIEEVQQKLQKKNCLNNASLVKRITSIITVFQIVFCTIQILLTPLKIIPYDTITSKTINSLTLLSFGLLFLSYFISAWINEGRNEMQEKLDVERNISIYYLDVIEKISNENTHNNEKSKEEV